MMVVFKLITLNMKVGLLAIKNMYFFYTARQETIKLAIKHSKG